MKKIQYVVFPIIAILLATTLFGFTSIALASENNNKNSSKPNDNAPNTGEDLTVESSCFCSYAKWKEDNRQKYLHIITTTYYELGYLEGQNLANEILTMDYILKNLIASYNLDINQVIYLAYIYDQFIPEEYKMELTGIADAIPTLSYTDILLQVVFLDLYYGILIPQMIGVDPALHACTAISAKNSKTSVTIGQTMDFGLLFYPTLNFVKHTVIGKQTAFSLRMGAAVLPIGKNRRVSSTVNLVQTWKVAEFGIPTCIKSRIAFETCKTAKEFSELMTSSYCCSWNYMFSDKRGNLIVSETIPSLKIEETINKHGFAVRTNTYISEELKIFLLDPLFSIERQQKAEELTQQELNEDGKLSVKELMNILSYYDGTEASICRYPIPNDLTSVCTLAFFVSQGCRKGYFGIGNTRDSDWGRIPL